MGAKDVLLEQFTACYDKDDWFVTLKTALDGVTAEQAAWKPDGVDNSIWETVNHLAYWNERYLQIWRKEMTDPQDVENKSTFKSDETDWSATLRSLNRVMDEWRAELTSTDDARLNDAVAKKDQRAWWTPLAHQNIHNAYHFGQILLIRKLQGSWDPKKGVS
jgi:uncharacterized damage-inducible protein DinB